MNNENSNFDNSERILKILNRKEIPQNYTGIIEFANGSKEWYLNGKPHRTDGPAKEFANGSKEWYLNGKFHRTDGPAVEHADGYKAWLLNGELHRTDGPAIEDADGYKEWWINGFEVNPLFFEIPDCEKYVDYYITILKTELVEHEEFLLKELKKRVESGIKLNGTNLK